jgi:hypothetical protein
MSNEVFDFKKALEDLTSGKPLLLPLGGTTELTLPIILNTLLR